MEAKKLKEEQEKINDKIIKIYQQRKENFDKGSITDGVTDIDGYLQSKPRIAWILKEAWDKGKASWSITEDVIADLNKDNISGTPSFKRVAYTTFGIQTESKWDDMPWIYNDENVANAIKKVAWLNVSKVAGESVSYSKELEKASKIWEEILDEQIKLYDPQVIILGNTYNWVKDILKINKEPEIKENSAWAYKTQDDKIVIWAYHPAIRRMKDQDYIDDIIEAIKKAQIGFGINF